MYSEAVQSVTLGIKKKSYLLLVAKLNVEL